MTRVLVVAPDKFIHSSLGRAGTIVAAHSATAFHEIANRRVFDAAVIRLAWAGTSRGPAMFDGLDAVEHLTCLGPHTPDCLVVVGDAWAHRHHLREVERRFPSISSVDGADLSQLERLLTQRGEKRLSPPPATEGNRSLYELLCTYTPVRVAAYGALNYSTTAAIDKAFGYGRGHTRDILSRVFERLAECEPSFGETSRAKFARLLRWVGEQQDYLYSAARRLGWVTNHATTASPSVKKDGPVRSPFSASAPVDNVAV